MTEDEWLACSVPELMLESLRGKASERKLRLVAGACCRLDRRMASEPGVGEVIEVAERRADGLATGDEVRAAVVDLAGEGAHPDGDAGPLWKLHALLWESAYYAALFATPGTIDGGESALAGGAAGEECCRRLRCLFGNPFPRPARRRRSWLTGAVTGLIEAGRRQPAPARSPRPSPRAVLPRGRTRVAHAHRRHPRPVDLRRPGVRPAADPGRRPRRGRVRQRGHLGAPPGRRAARSGLLGDRLGPREVVKSVCRPRPSGGQNVNPPCRPRLDGPCVASPRPVPRPGP